MKEDSGHDNNDPTRAESTERGQQEADMKRKLAADRMGTATSSSKPDGASSPLVLRRVKAKLRIQPISTCQGLIKKGFVDTPLTPPPQRTPNMV